MVNVESMGFGDTDKSIFENHLMWRMKLLQNTLYFGFYREWCVAKISCHCFKAQKRVYAVIGIYFIYLSVF